MPQTLIIHGAPSKEEFYNANNSSMSNTQWIPWLQKQLALRDELGQALEYPKPYDPSYEAWLAVFKQQTIDGETTLIGHSCGGGFLIRFFSENPEVRAKKVILVAPWLDPRKELSTGFFDFEINPAIQVANEIHVFMSSDDDDSQLESFAMIKKALPDIRYHEYADKEHFCTKEFPELLALLI